MMRHASAAKSIVFWDINRCPVPHGCAKRVGPCIKQGLEILGFSGSFTVVAIGDLTKISIEDLTAMYDSGVSLAFVDPRSDRGVDSDIWCWAMERRGCDPPGNILLLSEETSFLPFLHRHRFNIIRELPYDTHAPTFPNDFPNDVKCDLWRSVVAGLSAGSSLPDPTGELGELVHTRTTCYCQEALAEMPFEEFIVHLVQVHGLEHREFSSEPMEQPEERERKKRKATTCT